MTRVSLLCELCNTLKLKGKMNLLKSPKNFPEDFVNVDNGMYQRHCLSCGTLFFGHKERRICKACENQIDHRTQHQKDRAKAIYDRWCKYRMLYLMRFWEIPR